MKMAMKSGKKKHKLSAGDAVYTGFNYLLCFFAACITAYPLIYVFSMSISAPEAVVANTVILPNEVVYETVMNAIVLPLFFLSTALFPAEGIDGVLGVIVNLNPFTHIINALRSLLLNGTLATGELLFVIILYTAMGSISFGWALHRLNRETAL